jgi:hypothetical protein
MAAKALLPAGIHPVIPGLPLPVHHPHTKWPSGGKPVEKQTGMVKAL